MTSIIPSNFLHKILRRNLFYYKALSLILISQQRHFQIDSHLPHTQNFRLEQVIDLLITEERFVDQRCHDRTVAAAGSVVVFLVPAEIGKVPFAGKRVPEPLLVGLQVIAVDCKTL